MVNMHKSTDNISNVCHIIFDYKLCHIVHRDKWEPQMASCTNIQNIYPIDSNAICRSRNNQSYQTSTEQ